MPGWAVLLGLVWLGLVAWVAHVHAREGLDATLCWWRSCTGLPCPTCGTTRACVLLLEGDPLAALRRQPLLAVVALALPVAVARLRAGRPPVPGGRAPAAVLVAVVALAWVWQLALA